MKVIRPMSGVRLAGKKNFLRTLGSGTFVLVVICLGVYLVWHHYSNRNTPANLIREVNSQTLETAQNALKSGDYESYQNFTTNAARSYMTNNDVKDAEAIMRDVFAKVPAAKINQNSLATMIEVQDAKADYKKEKYYDQQLIKLLQAKGDNVGAQLIQKQMGGL